MNHTFLNEKAVGWPVSVALAELYTTVEILAP